MTPTATPRSPREPLLRGRHGWPTLGLLLVITLVAFEALAVATAMPTTAAALHGLALYSWGFTAFLGVSLVGVVDAGARTDRGGPAGVLVMGLVAFAVGLLVSGFAPSMPVFVLGRAVSGFGAGQIIVALYVVVARVYDDALRPRVFAAMSAAWVVPALVGPVIAGAVTENLGWRWVFLGLPPLIVLGFALLGPALRRLPPPPVRRPGSGATRNVAAAILLAVAVALVQSGGGSPSVASAVPAALGVALLVPPLRRLLPSGALRARRGLPAAIAFRGLLAGSFFGAEIYLPLALSTVHGLRPTLAGLPLTFGALGWSAASGLQGRLPAEADRVRLVRLGFGLIAAAVAALALVSVPAVPAALAVPLWTLAGAGMGFAMPTISLLTLALSPEREQGGNAASLQIADAVGSAVCIAAGAVIVALAVAAGPGRAAGIAGVDIAMALVALAGAALSGRLRTS